VRCGFSGTQKIFSCSPLQDSVFSSQKQTGRASPPPRSSSKFSSLNRVDPVQLGLAWEEKPIARQRDAFTVITSSKLWVYGRKSALHHTEKFFITWFKSLVELIHLFYLPFLFSISYSISSCICIHFPLRTLYWYVLSEEVAFWCSSIQKYFYRTVTCRVVLVTKWRVLIRMIGFISSFVTHSFNYTQITALSLIYIHPIIHCCTHTLVLSR
jgi:hypothetical protein